MPIRLATICRAAGCSSIADKKGYCIPHSRAYEKSPYRTKQRAFYASAEWRDVRAKFLWANPMCWDGCGERATEVDHIQSIREGGHPFAWSNLRGFTKAHHSRRTVQDGQRWPK